MQHLMSCQRCNERRATRPVLIQPTLTDKPTRLLVCEGCARLYRGLLADFFEPAIRRSRAERVEAEQRFAEEAERQRALAPQDDGYLTDEQAAKRRALALETAQMLARFLGDPEPESVPFQPLTRAEIREAMEDARRLAADLPEMPPDEAEGSDQ